MLKKLTLPILIFLFISFQVISVFSWGNGVFSSDPPSPDYGTHDWIAQHALDWLPLKEKQFILNCIAYYLYGTELPDNNVAPDHIGDTVKHHVYYFDDGSLQENDSAVRAQEEYDVAVDFFKSGDLANASKRLDFLSFLKNVHNMRLELAREEFQSQFRNCYNPSLLMRTPAFLMGQKK